MTERGKYIVIEGSDGTGKTKQAGLLLNRLWMFGRDPLMVWDDEEYTMGPISEPGGTPFADTMRSIIKDRTIERTPWQNVEWFTEARKSIWQEAIAPALESGRDVVTARNWISTITYQGYGEGIPLEEIIAYTEEEVGPQYMRPDYVCILALKDEIERRKRLLNRASNPDADTFESMPPEFQAKMQDGYVRFGQENNLEIISASGTPSEVHRRIWQHAKHVFDKAA